MAFFQSIYDIFYSVVIAENRYEFYLEGIVNTLVMTVLAAVIGVVIGSVIAMVKTYHRSTGRMKLLNFLCNVYTTFIRGTPVLVQLLIIYYMIFSQAPLSMRIYIAALSFGINSGAYVSEIIRAGIQSIDPGQTEAGRSLGLGPGKTMWLIVMPQAVKNILPAIFNEMITLLKETSVCGWIGAIDITRAGDLVRSRTWNFYPLWVSAFIYLVLVLGLTEVQKYIERKMAAAD